MAASGVNFGAIDDDTFRLYPAGGVQIDSQVVSVDPTTGDVTITATVNSSAGDEGDLVLVTGDSSPIDLAGNRAFAGGTVATMPRSVPAAPVDDQTPPTWAVVSMNPSSITTAGSQVVTFVIKLTDT